MSNELSHSMDFNDASTEEDLESDSLPERAPVVCEEQSDDGSLLKHYQVFRSGLVFGKATGVNRSRNHQEASHVKQSPDYSATTKVMGDCTRNHEAKVTEQVRSTLLVNTADKFDERSETVPVSDTSDSRNGLNVVTTPEPTPEPQPLHIPILPFTLGPYPVPLGGLPHIAEETPSMCSDLTKPKSGLRLFAQPARGPELTEHEQRTDDVASEASTNASIQKHSMATLSALDMGSIQQESNPADASSKGMSSSFYTRTGAPDSNFREYNVDVDPTQGDRGADIPLFSFARPHMRGFHFAWMSFFVAFFAWFAMTPLLAEIARTLDFTREEIFLSSVLAVLSSGFTRIVIGPLNDLYGPRRVMCLTLLATAIPTVLSGWLLRSTTSLYILRFFIGVAGSSFVTCQYWTLSMFTQEIAGTASSLAAGWGNLGGGVAQVVMGSILFPLAKFAYGGSCFGSCTASTGDHRELDYDRPSELAWRTTLCFPAVLLLVMAYWVMRYSDDSPKGKKRSSGVESNPVHPSICVTLWENLRTGSGNFNTLFLGFQYGCCFGVEITMMQAASWYFIDEFGQSTESAAAIASAFGWMNLFARGVGGYCSDLANDYFGLRGRLWCQVLLLIVEGCFVILFGYANSLGGAISAMVFFSIFVQAAEGSTFGVVPYVDRSVIGSVAGLVAAGGDIGGACFAFVFARCSYRTAFLSMGSAVVLSALWSTLISIPGHGGLFFGSDSDHIVERRQKTKPPMIIFVPASDEQGCDTTRAEADIEQASSSF